MLLELGGTLVGVTICEDMWQPGPPATDLALAGAELLVNICASPFHVGKEVEREEMFVTRARDNACFVAFCNAVGGQDELIFDGHSCVLDDEGEVVARAPGFEETLLVVDIEPEVVIARRLRDVRRRALAREREIGPPVQVVHVERPRRAERQAGRAADRRSSSRSSSRCGSRSSSACATTCRRTASPTSCVGVSGGIDSARDRGARRRSARRRASALRLDAVALLVRGDAYRRSPARREPRLRLPRDLDRADVEAFMEALRDEFAGLEADLTEENLQARIRGTLLMALSNKFGWLVLATGNKSELSVGYSTLYGDLAGGFALIKDVYKTDVFRLARHLNERAGRELIPSRSSSVRRAPSCARTSATRTRCRPTRSSTGCSRRTSSSTARARSSRATASTRDVVDRAVAMIDRAEYKRRQAPPGVRLRPKAFGRDRRTPITNRWRG